MKVVVEGTKSDGEKFGKEVRMVETMLYLGGNQLVAVDLSPLEKCTKLQKLSLGANELASVDLAPLAKCTKLQELLLESSTTIRWESPNLTINELPEGLQEYQEAIKQAWEAFTKAEQKQ